MHSFGWKIVVSCFALLFFNTIAFSQDCPFGMENCTNPCGRWIDRDGDGVCDRSFRKIHKKDTVEIHLTPKDTSKNHNPNQTETNHTTNSLKSKESKNNSSKKVVDSSQNKEAQNTTSTSQIAELSHFTKSIQMTQRKRASLVSTDQPAKKTRPKYRFILYSSLTIGAYLLSLLLMKLKIYKKKTHRRIWNVLLLITFLVSGLLGLVLVIQINYNVLPKYFLQFLKWHVDFGIGMAIISIFHIIWHFTYFKNIFTINRNLPQ